MGREKFPAEMRRDAQEKVSRQTVVSLLASTTTRTEVTIQAALDSSILAVQRTGP